MKDQPDKEKKKAFDFFVSLDQKLNFQEHVQFIKT